MVRDELKRDELPGEDALIRFSPDLIYLALVFILMLLGTVMLYSAGSAYYEDDVLEFIRTRAIHLLVGGIGFTIPLIALNPTIGRRGSIIVSITSVLLLIAVLLVGKTAGGAKRWLDFGFVQFQPSELAKTALILVLANYYSKINDGKKLKFNFKNKQFWIYGFIIPILIIAVPCVLVILERHISGTVIIFGIGAFMMFIGGTNIVPMLISGGAVGTVLGIVAWNWNYARDRITGWLSRGSDPDNDWQTTEGLYAMGNGGFFGVGLGNSSLKYGYVSQPQNDFIFSVVCEELGFFGAVLVILLFLAMFARGIRLSQKCEDRFCSLVIAGISFKFVIHALLNIAVVAAVIPNTGISLPFFSSGGSATLIQMLDAGIVLGMSRYAHD